MNKVKIVAGSMIFVGDEQVGRLDGRSEVYVLFKQASGEYKVVARFKYKSAKSSAVHWVKFMLGKMTQLEVIEALSDYKDTPIGLAEKYGYVCYNVLHMQKLGLVPTIASRT
jgi:hypothetical protein